MSRLSTFTGQKKPTQQGLILKTDFTIHYCNYNTMQHTATHCNTLQHTVTHCIILHLTATYCNILQRTATHCKTLQHTATHCKTVRHNATHCNTLNNKRALQKQCSLTKETWQCMEPMKSSHPTRDPQTTHGSSHLYVLSRGVVIFCEEADSAEV